VFTLQVNLFKISGECKWLAVMYERYFKKCIIEFLD
jgi:hypothetical protein